MLKAHQACIDLEKNVLRISGREVKFLAEHELPDQARTDRTAELEDSNKPQSTATGSNPPTSTPQPESFPGGGNTLGQAPQGASVGSNFGAGVGAGASAAAGNRLGHPEGSIATLVELGATRDDAIRYLEMAGGNVDLAASFLF